jgi:hypothetical protein
MAASEQGLLTDVTRVSTILIRGGYLIRQSTLGKTMSTDDKKTSPAPKNGGVEKKAVAAKKDEGQPKDKTAADADRSQAESGETVANSPSGCSRGEGQNPFRKHIEIIGTLFSETRKRRGGNGSMEQVSPYPSEPKADFTLKYESVAVKLSLDQSIEEVKPNLSVLVRENGR